MANRRGRVFERTTSIRGQAAWIRDLELREAIVRYGRQGRTQEEIAHRLGIPLPEIEELCERSIVSSTRRDRKALPGVVDTTHPTHMPDARKLPVYPHLAKRRRGPGPGEHILSDPILFAKTQAQRAAWLAEAAQAREARERETAQAGPAVRRARRQRALPAPSLSAPRSSSASSPPRRERRDDTAEAFLPNADAVSSAGPPPVQPQAETDPEPDEYLDDPSPLDDPDLRENIGMIGEILEPPDVIQMRKDCLRLRKAMLSFDKIGDLLGISTQEAQRYTAEGINGLHRSEQMNADMHRQLMVEQIEQMMAAIHAPATGETLLGRAIPVEYEAIDRMLKLMKQKADLLGISQAPAVDIRIQLQQIADDGNYDLVELEDIAREVISAQKLRLPELRS